MNYHDIKHFDILNGEGVRVSLWVSGCKCHCPGCHNQQTWDFDSGIPFDQNAFDELIDALDKPYIQGLTLTGGNPLDNISEVLSICSAVKHKFPNKDIWLYSGYTFEYVTQMPYGYDILQYVDVLIDGPYIEDLRDISIQWVGSKNQRLIDVQETLKQGQIVQYKIN